MASARWLFNLAAAPRKHRVKGQMLSAQVSPSLHRLMCEHGCCCS